MAGVTSRSWQREMRSCQDVKIDRWNGDKMTVSQVNGKFVEESLISLRNKVELTAIPSWSTIRGPRRQGLVVGYGVGINDLDCISSYFIPPSSSYRESPSLSRCRPYKYIKMICFGIVTFFSIVKVANSCGY